MARPLGLSNRAAAPVASTLPAPPRFPTKADSTPVTLPVAPPELPDPPELFAPPPLEPPPPHPIRPTTPSTKTQRARRCVPMAAVVADRGGGKWCIFDLPIADTHTRPILDRLCPSVDPTPPALIYGGFMTIQESYLPYLLGKHRRRIILKVNPNQFSAG